MKRSSLTLGEVLTATTILLLLVLVLSPVFSQVLFPPRPLPRPPLCQSNMRQLWEAMRSYAEDWDGVWVGSYSYPNTWGNCPHFIWADLIYPYLGTTRYFACPNQPRQVFVRDNGRLSCPPIAQLYGVPVGEEPGTSRKPMPLGYLFNEGLNDLNQYCQRCDCNTGLDCYHGMVTHSIFNPTIDDAVMDVGAPIAEIEDISTTIVITDGNPNCNRYIRTTSSAGIFRFPRDADVEYDTYGNDYRGSGCYVDGRKLGRVDKRHRQGANFLMVDGHARWLYQTTPNMWTRYAD